MQIRFFENAGKTFYGTQSNTNVTLTSQTNESYPISVTQSVNTHAPFLFSGASNYVVKATNDEFSKSAYTCNQIGSSSISISMNSSNFTASCQITFTAGDSDATFSKFYMFPKPMYNGSSADQNVLMWCIDLEEEITVEAGTSKVFTYLIKFIG